MVARDVGQAQGLSVECEGNGPGNPRRRAEGRLAPHVEEQRRAVGGQTPPELLGADAAEPGRFGGVGHSATIARVESLDELAPCG